MANVSNAWLPWHRLQPGRRDTLRAFLAELRRAVEPFVDSSLTDSFNAWREAMVIGYHVFDCYDTWVSWHRRAWAVGRIVRVGRWLGRKVDSRPI